MAAYETLPSNPFYNTMSSVIKSWAAQDVVMFSRTVDFTVIERLRKQIRSSGVRPPTFTALIIKAISLALREHPKVNRLAFDHVLFRRLVQLNEVHAMVAIERGLDEYDIAIPTVIRHTDRLSATEISEELARRARADDENDAVRRKFLFFLRTLPAWLNRMLIALPGLAPSLWVRHHGGSFLLTSPAKYGVEAIHVKTAWPLTFSFGLVEKRALVVDDRVVARPATTLTLSWHRHLTTGAVVARFFNEIVQRLQEGNLGAKAGSRKEKHLDVLASGGFPAWPAD